MKKNKIVFYIFILLLISQDKSYSLDIGNAEILIRNYSTSNINARIYPASAIFSGYNSSTPQFNYMYSFSRANRNTIPGWPIRVDSIPYLIGGDKNCAPGYGNFILVDFDDGDYQNGSNYRMLGGISFGFWKMDFVSESNPTDTESYYLDYRDFNIGSYAYPYAMDIYISLYGVHSDSVKVFFDGAQQTVPISDSRFQNRTIKIWDQVGRLDTATGLQLPPLIPNKGLFSSSNELSTYLTYPIDATKFGAVSFENPGVIGMNLIFNHDVTLRDTIPQSTNILIPSNGFLKIASGKTFNMNTAVGGSVNLIVQDSSMLSLETYSHLIVGKNNVLTLKSKGLINFDIPNTGINNAELLIESGALFCNEGGRINNGSIRYGKGYNHHLLCATVQDVFYSDSTKIILSDSAVMEIPDGVIMHFNGIKSGLIMNPNSKLKLGVGCKIIFDSSASLIANGATFTSIDSTMKWEGIVLSNRDADTITNCTFSNAVTALTITNDANTAYKNRIITNNTFNVPSGGIYKGIYGENNYKILLKGNTFNMPVYYPSASPVPLIYVGVYLKNSSTIEAAGGDIEEDQATNYSLNILENTFSNGCASVILANYTSNYLPYIISDNTFNNTASVNIIGMNITGTIRDNTFTSDDVPLGIHLINSSPNLYKNTINSRDVGLHLAGHSYPNLAPYVSGEDLVWKGGNNYITTTDIDNIQLSSSGYVNTDFGNNNFTADNSSSYHIYGWLDSAHSIYKSRDNCWNSSNTSRIYLKTYGSADTVPVPVINTNNYSCTGEINPTGWIVSYNGNGIYDSIKISDNYTGELPSDEDILYAQAIADEGMGLNTEAIIDYKYLFDNHPEYKDNPEILYKLYSCYQSLDTNEGQNYREPLYQNIVDYLNEKILSDEYKNNSDFCDNAYDIILMAQSIIDLNAAAGGYEFLAFNHPDPDIRLTASWNYAEIEELINSGNGGGEKQFQISNDKLQIEEQNKLIELIELKELNKLNELISNDPVMSKMKRAFDKTSLERKERLDKHISRETKNGEAVNDKIFRSRQIDIQKEERAKRNVFELKNATKEEKETRRMEDMALSTLDIRNEIKMNPKHNIPVEYKLEQNYPNPFNPVTTIKYSIPKDGLVTLKIYDVLGKEVLTLVNETKETGNYAVEFNGSNLASGAYFYRIESGMFTSIKRMILIK